MVDLFSLLDQFCMQASQIFGLTAVMVILVLRGGGVRVMGFKGGKNFIPHAN